jgi:hypothetical protein
MSQTLLRKLEARLLHRTRFPHYQVADSRYDPAYYASVLAGLRTHYRDHGWSDPFAAYEQLVAGLRDLPACHFVPVRELMSAPADGRTVVGLRYDVDADPDTAVRLARYNARYSLCGSFYLLHTAYYYGIFLDGVWCRNAPMIRDWVRALVLAGAEVGLHLDPLYVYVEHGMNGAEAVRTESAYLRAAGARVDGAVAHNSISVYGAENFEVFRGKTVWQRRRIPVKGDRWVPLGGLDPARCGIAYEGNYSSPVSRQPTAAARAWLDTPLKPEAANTGDWMRAYLFDNPCYRRAYDVSVWHHGGAAWTVAGRVPDPVWKWKVSQTDMLATLRALRPGLRISMVMHPIGFSADRA